MYASLRDARWEVGQQHLTNNRDYFICIWDFTQIYTWGYPCIYQLYMCIWCWISWVIQLVQLNLGILLAVSCPSVAYNQVSRVDWQEWPEVSWQGLFQEGNHVVKGPEWQCNHCNLSVLNTVCQVGVWDVQRGHAGRISFNMPKHRFHSMNCLDLQIHTW